MKELTAKGFLKQIGKLNTLISNKLVEKEQWKCIATGTTMQLSERVQSSGSQQKMADAVSKYIDMEKEIDKCIDDLIDKKQEVIRVIEQLDTIEYDVLHKIYVQFFTLQEVADMLEKSYSSITSIHGRALVNVQKILDEMECGM